MEGRIIKNSGDFPLPFEVHNNNDVLVLSLPQVSLKVQIADLLPDGKLLSEDEIAKIKMKVQEHKQQQHTHHKFSILKKDPPYAHRFKKVDIGMRYGLIVFDDQYYAIYRGVKQDCHLGKGGFGYAKLVQNIDSGEWAVIKLGIAIEGKNSEFELLERVGMAYGKLSREVWGYNSEFVRMQRAVTPDRWMRYQSNIVMKLAPGIPLNRLKQSYIQLSDVSLLKIIIQVLKAYERLEEKGIIHGDLKLNNIFYDFIREIATLIDYGASSKKHFLRHGANHELVYTEGYAAPELKYIEGKKKYRYTRATDIYALGTTILYFLRDENHDLNCRRIQNNLLRENIVDFCDNHMRHYEAGNRPSTHAAVQFFEDALASQLNILPVPIRKVGLVSTEEYLASLHAASLVNYIPVAEADNHIDVQNRLPFFFKKAVTKLKSMFNLELTAPDHKGPASLDMGSVNLHLNLLRVLKLFDEVWLIDDVHRDNKYYIDVTQKLMKDGIHVGDRCLIVNQASYAARLSTVAKYLENQPCQPLVKYYSVSTSVLTQDLPLIEGGQLFHVRIQPETDFEILTARINEHANSDIDLEYHKVRAALQSLVEKNEGTLVLEIQNTINQIEDKYAKGQLSFNYLMGVLRELGEKSAGQEDTSPIRREHYSFFSSKYNDSSSLTVNLSAIEKQIKEWAVSYTK